MPAQCLQFHFSFLLITVLRATSLETNRNANTNEDPDKNNWTIFVFHKNIAEPKLLE